jgi:hypothetical protein
MTYREPEAHLDAVVDRIWHLPGVSENAAIGGITFKDATTLERMRARGCSRGWSVDLHRDLGATYPSANIESMQALLTPAKAAEIVRRHGPVDILIARHIVEHAEEPPRLLQALATLIAPGGYLIIEVPDCAGNLARQDYTMIWEEHDLYLTSETAPRLLALAGCVSRGQDIYPFPFEDVIVLYGQKVQSKTTQVPVESPAVRHNSDLARRFGSSFDNWSWHYQRVCADLTKDGRKLAAYGAGHLTCAFLHFHELASYFAFVVDDTPHKQGLFLPKSGLEVVPRSRLTSKEIGACFFGLTPQIEEKTIANNADFVNTGGRFYSMLVDSTRSIRNLVGKH